MFGIIATALIAFLSLFIPGVLLAFALLKKTELHTFEITVIGFIFGLIAVPTLTWLESYLMFQIHFFAFSLTLVMLNALILTIIGALLCWQQGVIKSFLEWLRNRKTAQHHQTEHAHHAAHPKHMWVVWLILVILMLTTFTTRMMSIGTVTHFFEFDPYFDMFDAQYILTYGQQLLLDPSAWPVVAAGTNHRLQPIVPYLEAYWYDLANKLQVHTSTFSTNLMSYVGGVYPPIVAALLVFVIFILLYHEYDHRIALIGAGLTSMMHVLFSTFVAGEQLVEPWGIMTLFFFFAAYMLAIRNMKSKRLAILAGIAFASTFLGAHYYTVDAGILMIYILLQGIINIIRKEMTKDFYKMNIIVLITIIVFFALYDPYQATLQSNIPSIAHIPLTIALPLSALIIVAILDYIPKLIAAADKKVPLSKAAPPLWLRVAWIIVVLAATGVITLFTKAGTSIQGYIELSTRFTTASKPLFMTVQEFIPTTELYNFASQGLGQIANGINITLQSAAGPTVVSVPIFVFLISIIGILAIAISVIYRRSRTGILYLAIILPLMFAGFSEVKYLPHFGVAYIMMLGIIFGELLFLAQEGYKFILRPRLTEHTEEQKLHSDIYHNHRAMVNGILVVGLFALFGVAFPIIALVYYIYKYSTKKDEADRNVSKRIIALSLILILITVAWPSFILSENSTFISAFSAGIVSATNPAQACSLINAAGNSIGYSLYCNVIPKYWLNSMSWIKANVGANAPRVLAWWDYGDWINWFGGSNAVLRGDNSVASEDYAVAAQYVLGPMYNATPQSLAKYMQGNQTKYVLFDQDLVQKWQALNFLACINANQTSMAFAQAQGALQNPPAPYVLGSSNCELAHTPQLALIPLSALIPTNSTQQAVNNYCQISSGTSLYAQTILLNGQTFENQTVCTNINPNKNGVLSIYNQSGGKLNAVIQAGMPEGEVTYQGITFVQFMVIYLPNANGTVENAPTQFYNSNYYNGFFLGKLPGFSLVYPSNSTGINFVNGTWPVRIYAINNYTGGLPPVPAKPSFIHNNYTMP